MYSDFTNALQQSSAGFDFVAAHFACENDKYSLQNPQGYVNFGSAQNGLNCDTVHQQLVNTPYQIDDLKYQSFSGTAACRRSVAQHLSDIAGTTVGSEHLVVGNGLISLLEALAVSLLNPGDVTLVPTPVFPGLVTALTLRTGAVVEELPLNPNNDFRLSPQTLETALRKRLASGQRVKAILLCSPGNPVGQVFSQSELQSFVNIAEEYNVQLVVDEIYACSCFVDQDFTSTLSFQSKNVCVIGGLSKDFGVAGLATGWVHTIDPIILTSLQKQSHFFRLSAPVQQVIITLLEPVWRKRFIEQNRQKLTDSFDFATLSLQDSSVRVVPADAGLVLWFDLRPFLVSNDLSGQLDLYRFLLEKHRVHISPGSGFHFPMAGFFRLCFSQPRPVLREGLRRLKDGLAAYENANYLKIGKS